MTAQKKLTQIGYTKSACKKAIMTRIRLWVSNGRIGTCVLTTDDLFNFGGQYGTSFVPIRLR